MKKLLLILTMWCLLLATVKGQTPANFSYSSGRLFADPKTPSEINSPYLAFFKENKQLWMAYDPNVAEGRFIDVASSFTGAVTCGYVKGPFNFLGKRTTLPSDQSTAIVASVDQSQKLQWLYTHQGEQPESKFLSIVKLADGSAVVSGYEYDKNNKEQSEKALLFCIDRNGELVWKQEIEGAKGYQLRVTKTDEIHWMILSSDNRNYRSKILHVDPFTGAEWEVIEEIGFVNPNGIKGSISFDYTGDEGLVSARLTPDGISLNKYNKTGQTQWTKTLPSRSQFDKALELTGVVQRPNGHFQMAFNQKGTLSFLDGSIEIHANGESSILLITFDSQGQYIGYEQYSSELATSNNIFRAGDKIGIVGCHQGNLQIQDSLLIDSQTFEQAYTQYLDDYSAARLKVSTSDTTQLTHVGGLTIYPNPVNDGFVNIINEQTSLEHNYKIDFYDATGRLHQSMDKIPASEITKDQVDVSELTSGLYHVFLSQNGQIISSGRFIIQK